MLSSVRVKHKNILPLLFFNLFPPHIPPARWRGEVIWIGGMCEMNGLDELERLYESVWNERENGNGSVRRERKEKKRKKWVLIKQPIMPRGTVMYENHVFRVEQRGAFRYITPKHQYVRVNEKGRKSVQKMFELAEMTYDEFFDRFLSYEFDKTVANGRVSGMQRKFLTAIANEGVLPMTGDIIRG